MGCTFRARLNQIGSIWYTLIVLTVQSYLLYLGFERYKLYNEMKWPTSGYPNVWLTAYVTLYAFCIPASLLFFSFGFFKSGNIAGDNDKLTDREDRIVEVSRNRKGEKTGCLHKLKSLWEHSPPMPQQIHVIMALCQLVAQQLMISQLYRHGFINSGDFLNTEMDFLYQRARQLATNLPMGETRLTGFQITAEELRDSPLAPNVLPLLMNFRLFGIPLEFLNLILALVAYSCAYPAVFWRVSKSFSLIFSLHLLVYSTFVIWGYLAFSVLFRIQETNYSSLRPVGLGQYLVNIRHSSFHHPLAILLTFVLSIFLASLAPVILYTYGYNKYFVNLVNLQLKNRIRAGSSNGQSEYSDYRRRSYGRAPSSELCCDGYGPHMTAIVLLCLIIITLFPTGFAMMTLYQHEDKPLLITCLIVDVVYVFLWIIYWLILTMKRDWSFNIVHRTHQFYALQKGMASGHIKGNENPSQLKNALIVMHKDHMFVTDDQATKQSLLRYIQRGQFDNTDDSYWLKANGNHGSPAARKIIVEENNIKNTPEMSRLIRRTSDDNSQSTAYNSVTRSSHIQPPPTHSAPLTMRGNSSPSEDREQNTFGTLQRSQQATYMSTLQRSHPGNTTLHRSIPLGQWATPQEAYASIHKAKEHNVYQRGSNEVPNYGQSETTYSSYGTYARLPQQDFLKSRIPVQPGQQHTVLRINNSNYGLQQQNTLRDLGQPSVMGGIRQSPIVSERGSVNGLNIQSSTMNSRDQSPYQRSTIKLTSFNNSEKGITYGSAPSQWSSQRNQSGQSSQALWNQNKSSMSASSSQQDSQSFNPTSTLSSQGSTSNYSSQHTPTPSSPQTSTLYTVTNGGGGIYGNLGEETYGERTLQKPLKQISTGSTSVRHAVKTVGTRNDDSANFCLASSTGSSETMRANSDFATSIV